MSLKLYFAPGACSFVPHTLLETAGADYEPLMVKLHKGENHGAEFKAAEAGKAEMALVSAAVKQALAQ